MVSSTKSFHGVEYYRCRVDALAASLLVYVYWVDGVLIDSGPSRLRNGIDGFCSGKRLDKIVHTHFHEDHTGNTGFLSTKYKIPSYIAPLYVEDCMKAGRLPFYRRVFWGERPAFNPLPLPTIIENGTTRLKVIPTPGHTYDHVVFLNENEGLLFTGDLYVHHKTRIIMRQENMPVLMDSLRRLLNEEFDTVFCSHAGVVENGYELIRKKLEHLEALQEQVISLSNQGLVVKEIYRRMFPKRMPIQFFSNGEWSPYHIVRSLIEDRSGVDNQ
ncbi:MAG: MBL fold metallo-hydrolase [Syntrophomonas sp.]